MTVDSHVDENDNGLGRAKLGLRAKGRAPAGKAGAEQEAETVQEQAADESLEAAVEAALEVVHDDVEVRLAHALDDHLVSLVADVAAGRVIGGKLA